MSKGNRTLRFSSIDAMPESLRKMVVGQQALRAEALPPAAVAAVAAGTRAVRANKYGNSATYVRGIRFASKREARYFEELLLRRQTGEVNYFLRQVPVHLMSGVRYVVDFLIFFADGRVSYVDCKGFSTQLFRVKQREVEAQYPIKIEVVK